VKEKEYVNSVFIAIESTYRSLATIANGRNNNYREINAIREQQVKNMQSFSSLIPTLQSTIPRLAEMTVGGIAAGALVGPFFQRILPSLGDSAFQISVALGAVIFWGVAELWLNPWLANRELKKVIRLDYDKDLYYQQYLKRSKNALSSLYEQIEDLHEKIFGIRYKDNINAGNEVNDLMVGLDTTMCENISKCIDNNKVTPDNWAVCESGETKEDCDEYLDNQ